MGHLVSLGCFLFFPSCHKKAVNEICAFHLHIWEHRKKSILLLSNFRFFLQYCVDFKTLLNPQMNNGVLVLISSLGLIIVEIKPKIIVKKRELFIPPFL